MSNELHKTTPAPATVYAIVRRASDLAVYNGSGLETWDDAHITTYAVFLPNIGGDDFAADFPTGLDAARYYVSYYLQGGGTPATDDFRLPGEDTIDWRGDGAELLDPWEPTVSEWEPELGPTNTNLWVDLENQSSLAHVAQQKEHVRQTALVRLETKFNKPHVGSDGVTRTPVQPWVFTDSATRAIKMVLIKYHAGYALKLRSDQGGKNAAGEFIGDEKLRQGDEMLADFIAGMLTGVTVDETEGGAGTIEFATITRTPCDVTGDENYRPPLWY